ncbi:virion structural protein [Synechococcus phage S-MbCM6]|uniref:Virion structural protein n=1 Tax=Synechococcus phage ACG-2014c TaxID=1079998 RepID=A0A0E3FA33_9CAUD|nr:virion structural protein [Synechococcus phage ACG-2014c]
MPQNTNLNVTPYYDDFDKDKNFYKVLFRPGFPIQAREITTMQSILQNQVENIGTHFFKEGAMVIPGQVGYDLNVQAVLLQESFLGSDIETYRTQLNGTIIEGLTTGVKAKVLYSISAEESEKGYITLYVKYIDSGDTTSDTSSKTFQTNEQLISNKEITFGTTLIEVGTPFAQLLHINAINVGSAAYIEEGVYFIRGYFVDVPSSYILLEQYSSNPSYRVGLEIYESIITPEDDVSLNDNAAGTSNYSAPGAHRFKISTIFGKKEITDEADKDFVELLRIKESKVQSFVNSTAYSELEKSLARRTFEESGDYVIDTFDVKAREHLDDGFNNGVYARGSESDQGATASEEKLAIEISPGKAYVRGYRTEFVSPQYVDVDKPREFEEINNGIINFTLGNFFKVYDVYGWPEISGDGVSKAYQVAELYDDWSADATSDVKSGANQIGRCRVVQMQESNTTSSQGNPFLGQGSSSGIYDVWFFDVQMWTVLNINNAVTPYVAGTRIKGRTSGATAYIASTGNNTHYIYVEQVSGLFSNGEILEIDGKNVGTLEAAHTYNLTDSRSMFGRNNTSAIRFGCNIILNDARPIELSTVSISSTAGGVLGVDSLSGGTGGYAEETNVGTTSSGSGTGLTVDLSVDDDGVVTLATINTPGEGYAIDEVVTIANTNLTDGVGTVDTISAADASRASGTYNIGASDYTTSGSGTNATFTITVDGSGAASIVVEDKGGGYIVNETFTVLDTVLGSGGAASLTFDVAALTGNTATVDVNKITEANSLTGFRTRFERDLRPGEVITPTVSDVEGNNTIRIERVNPAAIATTATNKKSTVAAGDEIFNYANQTTSIDFGLRVGSVIEGEYAELVRLRPYIFQKDYQNGELSFDLAEDAMRSLSDESFFVYRNFANKPVISGSITFTLPETEAFGALDGENFVLTIIDGGGTPQTFADGANLDIDALSDGGTLSVTYGANNQSIAISGLTGVVTVTLTALVSKNTVSKKIKTASKMKALKVIKTTENVDVQQTGLTYSTLFGTRVQDEQISFGINDVYNIHAVYESLDDNDASAPYIVLTESTFFATGSLIVGKTSGARGRVISFSNTNLRLYYVNINESTFISGETVEGFDTDDVVISGIIDDVDDAVFSGSKVITNQFTLDQSQKTNFYDCSRFVRDAGTVAPARRLLVIFDYFVHEASGDYFSAESYSGILYKEIPNIKLDGSLKKIRDQADFRPAIQELRNGSGTVTAPFFVNCSTFDFVSRVFETGNGSTIFDIMKVNTSFRSDYSWYLPRIDNLYLSHDGELRITSGVSGYYLIPPQPVQNAMLLATIEYKPYVFNPEDDVIITSEVIRRYTMKDIGALEDRLTNVEYYTSLSLLESQADNTNVYDENGFDRLKNGYVVDDFTDHTVGDVLSPDYKCSLDFREGQLRPSHYTTNVGLKYNPTASTNIVKTNGNVLMLPYEDLAVITQPYASRTINVNPFNVFTFIGRIDLTPASDDWIDTVRLPAKVENVEGDFSATTAKLGADPNTGFAPIQWGSWQTNWTGETLKSKKRFQSQSGTYGVGRALGRAGHGQRRQGLFYLKERRTFRVVNNQARQGVRTKVVPKIERKSQGDTILSQSAVPWIRSRNIGFNVDRMKPRTRVFAFFDGVNITTYITPKVIELTKNSSEDNRTNETPFVVGETVIGETSGCQLNVIDPNDGYKTNPYGKGEETLPTTYSSQTQYLNHDITVISENVSPDYFGNMQVGEVLVGQTSGARAVVKDRRLLTDNVGNIQGTFFVPSPKNDANPRWATGTRSIRFTTSDSNSRTPGAVESSADGKYTATGTLQTVRENILAIRNAEVVTDTVNDKRVVTTTRTETRQLGWYDPLAQSFIIEDEGGIFLTGVDIFFATKDTNIPVSMQIRAMENGYPSKSILPFSDITLTPDVVETSESAALPTRFTFKAPVYIKASVEYCFVLLSDSNEYTVWISRMGDVDVTGNRTISEQPYAGVLFKSQNASTWTADQYSDAKFTVYRAEFTQTTGTVALNNTPQGKGNGGIHRLIDNPIQTIKPTQTFSLPTAAYTYTEGARLKQVTTQAEATIVSFDDTADEITVNSVTGSWLQGTSNTYLITSSQSFMETTVTGISGTLSIGDVVTGSSSNSTGEVLEWDSGTGVLKLNFISGNFSPSETLTNPGSFSATAGGTTAATGDSLGGYLDAVPTYASDMQEVLVYHKNHCMHNRSNNVTIEGVISEITPTTLAAGLAISGTTLTVDNASQFHKIINGVSISNVNPGYLKIKSATSSVEEIIQYSAISNDGKTITVATSGRGASGTDDIAHSSGDIVECYNLDGIPLININKTHTSIECPWIDTYMLDVGAVATSGIRTGGSMVYSTQNIQFETLTPTVSVMDLPETTITARVNTTSATSVGEGGGEGGSAPRDQASFVNNGEYVPVTLNDLNFFPNPRMVCSNINEQNKLSGNPSFTMLIDLSTEKSTLSPVVDLDRCSLITTSNRINKWPGGPQPYGQQGLIDRTQDVSLLPFGDQNDCVYLTRLARLSQESRSLRIDFQMSRPPQAEVFLYYRTFDMGSNENPDEKGWTKMDLPLQYDSSPSEEILWKDYYYEVGGLNFNAFQIKIVMRSDSQARVPLIADLRAIAIAT